MHNALDLQELLGDEFVQRQQSGHQVDEALAAEIGAAKSGDASQEAYAALYDRLEQTPLRPDWEFEEPSDLADIEAAAPGAAGRSDRAGRR